MRRRRGTRHERVALVEAPSLARADAPGSAPRALGLVTGGAGALSLTIGSILGIAAKAGPGMAVGTNALAERARRRPMPTSRPARLSWAPPW